VRWYEFDIGWIYIRTLAALGLATVKRTIPVPKLGEVRKVVDFDMLQAVVTYRYDVMTRYVRSLKTVYGEEVQRLRREHGERFDAKRLKVSLIADATSLTTAARKQLGEALAASPRLAQLHQMREELVALWARSNATREQLIAQLDDWCNRAEASGERQLRDLATRLRSYAVTQG